ncbi:hypothetical protein [Actinoplanes sp. NPDC026619]|uniref:hypothetical protein n=1 Tax=Actinoplanes sp. NPDC026619 TaxID=3155798 RepID=UPI0033E9CCCE
MSRTTPPRPLDVLEVFPELREHSATATRLHPRPGAPAVSDSSVGGPLLWPAGEPWPVCDDGPEHYVHRLLTPATVWRRRAIYAVARTRQPYAVTDEERAQLPGPDFSEPRSLIAQPIPYVPVAQLFRRDVADFAGPDDADVLQVLWCPLDHEDEGCNPRVRLFWRRSADVGPVLETPPTPPVVSDSYLPTPCVVHPEQVRECQYADLLPADLGERIAGWELDYDDDFSLAPGWKVGGFANWSLTDPHPVECADCGTAMTLLLTVDSAEWYGSDCSWRPVEEPVTASSGPTDVEIGRSYALYVFRCPVSFDHPSATAMQ